MIIIREKKLQKVIHRITPEVGQFCGKESWLENLVGNEENLIFQDFFVVFVTMNTLSPICNQKVLKIFNYFHKKMKFFEKNHVIAPSYPTYINTINLEHFKTVLKKEIVHKSKASL